MLQGLANGNVTRSTNVNLSSLTNGNIPNMTDANLTKLHVRGWQQLGKSLVGSAVELNCLYKERLLNL